MTEIAITGAAPYAIMFGASYVYVFLRAMQQRNVAFDNYGWVLPVSVCMASVDVFVIATIASNGFHIWIVAMNGIGGGLGSICAMYIHRRFVKHG